MQIVIDIPEEMYKHTQEYEIGGFNQENDAKLFAAIRNGTPLPKGHGALKDAGMIKQFLHSSARFWGTWNLGKHRIFEAIDCAEVVVPVDKEENVK